MPVDTKELRKRLRRYDKSAPRCGGTSLRRTSWAPDWVNAQDPEAEEFSVTLTSPCALPEGHDGPCSSIRPVLSWPGYDTINSMLDEIDSLRVNSNNDPEEGT